MQIPVFAIRLLRLSSLDSHELEQSSIPVAKGKAMFPNSSIIDTLEQMTESRSSFWTHPRLVLRLRRSENSAIRKIWNKANGLNPPHPRSAEAKTIFQRLSMMARLRKSAPTKKRILIVNYENRGGKIKEILPP